MNTPQLIPFELMASFEVKELIHSRPLQRDIHYTLSGATRDLKYVDEYHFLNPNPIVVIKSSHSASYHHETFRVRDSKHIYFFDRGWPVAEVPDFLCPEDIIPSGLHTLNTSYKNRERALAELLKEKATFGGLVQINGLALKIYKEDTFQDRRLLDAQFLSAPVRAPITDMTSLETAIYCSDPHILQVVGTVDIPFNKPLYRVAEFGGNPQSYNSKEDTWKLLADQNYKPSFSTQATVLGRKVRTTLSRALQNV